MNHNLQYPFRSSQTERDRRSFPQVRNPPTRRISTLDFQKLKRKFLNDLIIIIRTETPMVFWCLSSFGIVGKLLTCSLPGSIWLFSICIRGSSTSATIFWSSWQLVAARLLAKINKILRFCCKQNGDSSYRV